MHSLTWTTKVLALALTVTLTAVSCATQKSALLSTDGARSHAPPAERAPANAPATSARATAQAGYGQLPLHFEANRGQTDDEVTFLARGSGYTLFLTPREAVLVLQRPHEKPSAVSHQPAGKHAQTEETNSATVLRMQLVGANVEPHVAGLEALAGTVNSFIGNDPQKWRTHIPTYAQVKYQGVYPGVDLVYYGNQRRLEYDFIVAPGADPTAIRLAFAGVETLEVDHQGDLVLHTTGGELRLHAPLMYQELHGHKQPIPGGYVLNPQSKTGNPQSRSVGIHVAAYDPSRPLIIDPVLSYSTYLGGSGVDGGTGIAVDPAGNAYVTGRTFSPDFPTANPLQPTFSGDRDAFVAKLDPAGSSLIYSTYLGGSDDDRGFGIAVDPAGNAYVTGRTGSTNFPTANPLQPMFGGVLDAFVTRIAD